METASSGDLRGPFSRLADNVYERMSAKTRQYQVPEDFDPADHPPVKMRHGNHNADQSETQRKRRSKNRLSNRRSTGYVSPELVEEALHMGPSHSN
ncbi:uncharacterized protein LOC132697859 isoform X2 [Cylas formicarius]|uniref:uncharacterized protein LOC132697859 isoform X2 n=1 Tax=Cylas formicarius TaxID=197179 RepID=UPI00295869CF|nr:uncharacterized protein LOC132697859 isoform X2 [Cylas formicarius]